MPSQNPQAPIAATDPDDPAEPLVGSPDESSAADPASVASAAALIRNNLAAIPPAPKVSIRALVVALKPDLLQARRNGRSWKQIAAAFEASGIHAESDTIRLYVQKAVPTKAARAAKRTTLVNPTTTGPRTTSDALGTTAVSMAAPGTSTPAPGTTIGSQSGNIRSDGARITPRVR